MKKYLLLLVVLFVATIASAQKIDKYCQVGMYGKLGFTSKLIFKISFGADSSLFNLKDTTEIHHLKQVNKLTNVVDVLNFMSQSGWTVVSINGIYFKKTYDSSDFVR